VNNFAGLLVLRFLQGFFGSPCLANGAASLGDMYSMLGLPFAMIAWVSAAYCGPALGPLLSGFAVTAENWRWSLWEIFWAACPTLILMFALLPETSTPNLLLRRAARLRKLTGDNRLMSQSEIDQKNLNPTAVFIDALIKPLEITIKDPAIAFVNVYTALVYGIYYSFFEVFPLVYPVYYGFSIGLIGVVFLCILVACGLGVAVYVAYLKFYMIPDILKNGFRAQEHRLVPALFAAFGPPIGLFIFAWTAREDITWVAPTIGIVVYGATVFIVMQCIFTYVPMSYPQYAASLFAGNDFLRSALACGSILFARPLFINLGVDRGVSLLGGLSTLGIIGMFGLWIFGAKLRARSKFAVS
jgi:DHA1 family multidrug resistance protein-like MFS transporter